MNPRIDHGELSVENQGKFGVGSPDAITGRCGGVEKPDGRIFDITVDHAGVPHSRILFVGDHPEDDILAARKAGIDALLLDRHDRNERYHLPTIKSLAEVNDHVGA